MKKIRIDNIEFRRYPLPIKKGRLFYEIVKWEKNPYYNKEDELIKEGFTWSITGDFLQKDDVVLDKSRFINNETCYVIAWIKISDQNIPYMQTVGSRLLELNDSEFKTFMEIYREANKRLNKKLKNVVK